MEGNGRPEMVDARGLDELRLSPEIVGTRSATGRALRNAGDATPLQGLNKFGDITFSQRRK